MALNMTDFDTCTELGKEVSEFFGADVFGDR